MGYSPPVTETVENRSGVINVLANGVVYGGGKLGLMGAVASGALEAGGEVIGEF